MKKIGKKYFDEEFSKIDPWELFTSEYEKRKYQRQITAIEKFSDSPGNILEIGCAEGAHTIRLANKFPEAKIVGIEISVKAIERVKENCQEYENIELIEADIIEHIDNLPSNFFDVILQSESIYYIGAELNFPEMYEYFSKIVKVLRNNGILVMANIVDQLDTPETPLTKRGIMEAYYTMISYLAKPIYTMEYEDIKKELGHYKHKYHIRVFKKEERKK